MNMYWRNSAYIRRWLVKDNIWYAAIPLWKIFLHKNIVSDPAKYGLVLDDIPDAPYFAVVKTTKEMDVKRAAELAEMPLEEFQFLNPHFNRPVIAGADEYTILLPIDTAELFAAKLDLTDQPLVNWQAYRMHNGETLPQVAAKFGLPLESLPRYQAALKKALDDLGTRGRILVRYSGTENLVRVMVEGEDEAQIRRIAVELRDVLRDEISIA
jgi:membrane-bound lytic murein transglycosylase D